MKVALVCPYSLDAPGGVATHVMGLASWLARNGNHATVIAPGTKSRESPEGVTVRLLGRSRNFSFNGSVAQLAVTRLQCREAIRVSREADVVHVHEPLVPGIAYAVARSSNRLVVTHHASYRINALLAGLLRRRAATLSPHAVIAVSQSALSTAQGVTGWDPTVIANGVLLPDPPKARQGWRGGMRPRIGFVGRLDEPRKGFVVFRQLAALAAAHGMDADFVALGPGKAEAGRVRLLGQVDDVTRNRFLASVDVLVAPNLFGESFGLILVEALAAGCAVVASDLPAFQDVLEAAGAGETFATGDPQPAMQLLHEIEQNPPDPTALHQSSRRWGWDVLGPRVLALYKGLAPGVRSSSKNSWMA